MKFRKKPVVIEAITFDELVQFGKDNGANIINDMPWSFNYKGHPITHENDECYLIPTLEGTMRFNKGDMLITGVNGEIYPCKPDIFEKTYEPADQQTQKSCHICGGIGEHTSECGATMFVDLRQPKSCEGCEWEKFINDKDDTPCEECNNFNYYQARK